jgi:hypothetical protein
MSLSRKQRKARSRQRKSTRPSAVPVPNRLYKFLSFDRISALEDGLIRLTQPGDLNDPFEIRPVISQVLSQDERTKALEDAAKIDLAPILAAKGLPEEQIVDFLKRAVGRIESHISPYLDRALAGVTEVINNRILPEGVNKVFGVMSLTESSLSSLMWAHYGQSYQGLAIELDTQSLFFKTPEGVHEDIGGVRKVLYSPQRPTFDFVSEDTPSIDFLFTKPPEWSYEREWRFLRPLKLATKVVQREPFPIHLFEIPPNAITGIVLGFRVSRANFDTVSKLLRTSQLLQRARLFKVQPGVRTFDLEMSPLKAWEQLNIDKQRSESAFAEVLAAIHESNGLADRMAPSLAKELMNGLLSRK